ncbi:MAG: porin [Pseudomonadota bacterium]|nr:porin [Pseudomonadota bacterium]
MTGKTTIAALLAATALTAATPAQAQDQDAAAIAAELTAMRAKIDSLEAKLKAMETAQATAAPSWKGAPLLADKDSGWSFKPRGRIQYDAGYVESPNGVTDPGLGFSNELRRARLGVEGTMPGGFGYKFEADFADNEIEVADAILTYQASPRIGLTIGQHNNFQSLEELTSSRFSSFIERAAFTDAFNFERRVGISASYAAGPLIASAGIFTDNISDLANSGDGTGLGDENETLSADARLVFAPKLGRTQLHLGGSAHRRDFQDVADRGITTRYRQRPFIHSSNSRFLTTPPLRVARESDYGLEAAAISGPFHAAGEVHWLNANTIEAGLSPTLFGGYAELGYYFTGETRGYKGGQFDRTKVLRPLGNGGAGAFQLNLRYDHLDLIDNGVIGGKQAGYQASLIWIPQDYVRFLINYGHLRYQDAAISAAGDRDYGIDVIGARAQIDF